MIAVSASSDAANWRGVRLFRRPGAPRIAAIDPWVIRLGLARLGSQRPAAMAAGAVDVHEIAEKVIRDATATSHRTLVRCFGCLATSAAAAGLGFADSLVCELCGADRSSL